MNDKLLRVQRMAVAASLQQCFLNLTSLDDAMPGWRHTTRDCYFGHTHLPFTGYEHEGIVFHNTGSAIRGMSFRPLFFRLSA